MRIIVLFLLLIGSGVSHAQSDSLVVATAVKDLEKGLVEKKSALVSKYLHADSKFGHSNGWVQTKSGVLADMTSGYLVYKLIRNDSLSVEVHNNRAWVKERLYVEGTVNGVEFALKFFVAHLWIKTKTGWKLLMRQSAKQS